MQTLPPGCTEVSSGSSQVNVGTCSYEECIKRGEGDSGQCGKPEESKIRHCCSPTGIVNSPVTCRNGVKFPLEKVRSCSCLKCAVPDIIVRGRAHDEDGNPLKQGEISVVGDAKKYRTDLGGYFKIPVKAGTKRLVLTIKDKLLGQLQETTKALTIHEGQVSFYFIVLQRKPPPVKFSAKQEKKIPLGTPNKPAFVDVDIPARSFLTPDGNVYDGEIIANVGVVDPRNVSDMEAAPGDFSAIGDDGEEELLGTAGILRQAFTDSSGNKLNLDRNMTIKMDAAQLDIPEGVTVYQYYLSKITGRWVKFGVLRTEIEAPSAKRQVRRKFFVSDITPNVPYDTINWDYPQRQSIVRIRAPAGTVVTRIHLSDNGQSFTSYRQETVTSSGTLCMRNLLNRRTVMQAERDGSPLVPQQPSNFPSAVNAEIISGSSASNPFKIQSFRFICRKAGDSGPVYGLRETGRCLQKRSGDLAFEFQRANAGEVFHWESSREEDPNSDLYWFARAPDICFVKALVSGSKRDSVIYVKSIGKAPNVPVRAYGYTAEKSTVVGNQGVVCLEYRCNQGQPSTYQTHLQFLSLTGRCTIRRLNSILAQRQSSCPVRPASPSSVGGQELNICVPVDLQGGDAGLYTGDSGVAKSRCLTGDNNYSQGRPQATTRNPTVELTCKLVRFRVYNRSSTVYQYLTQTITLQARPPLASHPFPSRNVEFNDRL